MLFKQKELRYSQGITELIYNPKKEGREAAECGLISSQTSSTEPSLVTILLGCEFC